MSLVIFTCVVGLLIAPNEVIVLNASLSLIAVALGAGAAGGAGDDGDDGDGY